MGGLDTVRVSARGDLAPQSPNLVKEVVKEGGGDLAPQSPNLVKEVVREGSANHVDEEAPVMEADGSRVIPVGSDQSSLPLAIVVQEQEQKSLRPIIASQVMMTKKKAGENTR